MISRRVMDLTRIDPNKSCMVSARPSRRDLGAFPQRHRAGTGEEARQASDKDRVRPKVRAGHAHDEAQIGAQPVIGAEHRSAQRIAAQGAMSALQSRNRCAAERAWRRRRQRLDNAGVRALGRGQPAGVTYGVGKLIGVAITG